MNAPQTVLSKTGKRQLAWGDLVSNTSQRVGVVDVGSNSVRLVIFDGVARSPAYFYNEKVLCGLGAGLNETGVLNPDGRARAMSALHRFVALAELMQTGTLMGVATAAVREARDGPAFCQQVLDETGLDLHVASGAEEARLSAQGVLLGWPRADGIVCDIGGASMEMARVESGDIGACQTAPLGPLLLANLAEADVGPAIDAGLSRLSGKVGETTHKLYLVGGSWRAIARIDMERRNYPLKVLHEYRLTRDQLMETSAWIAEQTPQSLSDLTDASQARLDLVPMAARVLNRLLERMEPRTISISSYGIREGVLYQVMPAEMRVSDPLIEAARQMEQASARFPGFGETLYEWLQPLIEDRSLAEMRLVHAACLLHDITWRTHPDYRAEVCFESVTRANLSGLDHAGRVFLGLAILNRYKSASHATQFDDALLALLDEDEKKAAETLGKAMRLGAMLSGAVPNALRQAPIFCDETTLRLELHGPARELDGEVVGRRLSALASRMNLDPELVLKD